MDETDKDYEFDQFGGRDIRIVIILCCIIYYILINLTYLIDVLMLYSFFFIDIRHIE